MERKRKFNRSLAKADRAKVRALTGITTCCAEDCRRPNLMREIPVCERHFKPLPQDVKSLVWATYREGQQMDASTRERVLAAL